MQKLTHLFNRIRERLLVELDLLMWQWQNRARRRVPVPAPQKRALISGLLTSYATAKVEAIYAGELRQQGYAVTVILERSNRLLERIFRATGPTDFCFTEGLEHQPSEKWLSLEEETARLLPDSPTMENLLDLEWYQIRVGRHAMSSLVRRLRIGRLDIQNREHMQAAQDAIKQSISSSLTAFAVLDSMTADLALFCEKGYTPSAELCDACTVRGVDVVQWVGAPQSDHLVYKRFTLANRGDHPLALSKKTWEETRASALGAQGETDFSAAILKRFEMNYASGAWYNRQQLQKGKSILYPEQTRQKLGVAPGRKIAVIFAHILYDATFFYGDSLYPDYQTWLVETVRGAVDNPNLDWIVKVHPVNVWRSAMDGSEMEQLEAIALREELGDLPPHIRLLGADTDINTYSLFSTIDYGLTVRGTIGLELPCYGIRMVTAGTGRYSGAGFTIDPQNVEEYQRIIATLHTYKPLSDPEIRSAQLYAATALLRRPFPIKSFKLDFFANTFGSAQLKQNVFLHDQMRATGHGLSDLEEIVDWMVSGSDRDLLAPLKFPAGETQ